MGKLCDAIREAGFLRGRDLGWAYLGVHFNRQAEAELQTALSLRPDLPGVHCLLAQAKGAQSDSAGASTHWAACAATYSAGNSEMHEYLDPRWLVEAREHAPRPVGQ
jgi:predicted Zn-dependent protease